MKTIRLLSLISAFSVQHNEAFTSYSAHQLSPDRLSTSTSMNLFRTKQNKISNEPSKRVRVKRMITHKFKESRSKMSIILASLAILRGSMAHASTVETIKENISTFKPQLIKSNMQDAITDIKGNKRSAAMAVGGGTTLIVISKTKKCKKKNKKKKKRDEIKSPVKPISTVIKAEEEKYLKSTVLSGPTTVKGSADTLKEIDDSKPSPLPAVDYLSKSPSSSSARTRSEDEKTLIIDVLDSIGANPDIFYGFLGSCFTLFVSDDFLVAAIAFGWVASLFEKDIRSDNECYEERTDLNIQRDEEAVISTGQEAPTIMTEPTSDIEVSDYRPENIIEVPTMNPATESKGEAQMDNDIVREKDSAEDDVSEESAIEAEEEKAKVDIEDTTTGIQEAIDGEVRVTEGVIEVAKEEIIIENIIEESDEMEEEKEEAFIEDSDAGAEEVLIKDDEGNEEAQAVANTALVKVAEEAASEFDKVESLQVPIEKVEALSVNKPISEDNDEIIDILEEPTIVLSQESIVEQEAEVVPPTFEATRTTEKADVGSDSLEETAFKVLKDLGMIDKNNN